ncbi:hypothetical protein M885DRAFT_579983, partial [Pelagophyceae sp. CCMP2097]
MDVEVSRELELEGGRFLVGVVVKGEGDGGTLSIDVEALPRGADRRGATAPHRWVGTFDGGYVEELTSKTGNYKKLTTFAQMVLGALEGTANSVYIDLLSERDLMVLREKKMQPAGRGAAAASPAAADAPHGADARSRRYLIVTYAVEFDRVHYPLPLDFEVEPDAASLARRLRHAQARIDELAAAPADALARADDLARENALLRQKLREVPAPRQDCGPAGADGGADAAARARGDRLRRSL